MFVFFLFRYGRVALGQVSNLFGQLAIAIFVEPDFGMAHGFDMFGLVHFDAVNVRSQFGTLVR